MRPIKFRAWKDGIKYNVRTLAWHRENIVNILVYDGTPEGKWLCSWDALEQFTGMHDKNGVEIYEGDVLRKDWAETFNYYEIEFKYGAWLAFEMINFRHGSPIVSEFNALPGCLPRSMWKFAKVIGNIHDNPDIHETLMK